MKRIATGDLLSTVGRGHAGAVHRQHHDSQAGARVVQVSSVQNGVCSRRIC
jgi:hypothetical protein